MTQMKDSRIRPEWLAEVMRDNPIRAVLDSKTGQPNGNYFTGPVRLSWTKDLFVAKKGDDGKEKFGCSILFPLGADYTILAQAVQQCGVANFPQNMTASGFVWSGLKNPFHWQDEKMHQYAGYTQGAIFINSSTFFKPMIVDTRMNPIVDEKRVYPGVWAVAAVAPYPFNNKTRGVGLGLQSIMIIADDTNIGQGKAGNPAQDFAGINVKADTNIAAAFGQVAGAVPLPGTQSKEDILKSMGLA